MNPKGHVTYPKKREYKHITRPKSNGRGSLKSLEPSNSKIIAHGEMSVVFPELTSYEMVKSFLSIWFGIDINYLAEALSSMGLENNMYTAQITSRDTTNIYISISSDQTNYELRLYRGSMLDPYPCCFLKASNEVLWKCFIVNMKVDVQLVCVTTSSGSVVDNE